MSSKSYMLLWRGATSNSSMFSWPCMYWTGPSAQSMSAALYPAMYAVPSTPYRTLKCHVKLFFKGKLETELHMPVTYAIALNSCSVQCHAVHEDLTFRITLSVLSIHVLYNAILSMKLQLWSWNCQSTKRLL